MMDAYQGYPQIFMTEEDRDKTSFITEKGFYCYNVMPFGLNNASSTYQRLVNRMFKELIRSTMEVYVDDICESKEEMNHLEDLGKAFSIMRIFGMKPNPTKCTFGVRGGKSLGYLVSERGIEVNPEKIEAIMQLPSQKMIKDVQKLTGKIASLNQFIARSAYRNLPFFKVLRHVKKFVWSEECEKALQELKTYLATPPLLANPMIGEMLYVYLAVSENAAIELGEFNIEFQTRTAAKAQVFADFVAELSGESLEPQKGWLLHVDGSSNTSNVGARIFLQEPEGVEIEIAIKLSFPATNNEAEYEALIHGLRTKWDGGVKELDVYTDFQLVEMQAEGVYETRE
ncbi:UNVERIFIED_CONTAM: Enzymatic polyprotein [Sesamum radiatum]|uniref:Enzymatic polyprotein n=1 Tax=Sesamum radiatum TaxID=300843 RepID=A0AAW2VQN2_SESRA